MQDVVPKDKCTVYILGAGASYGSSISCPPPLMNNFIKQGLKLPLLGHYEVLWKFLSTLGITLSDLKKGTPNLEELFALLESLSSGIWYRTENDYLIDLGDHFWKVLPIDFLESFIAEVLNAPSSEAIHRPCKFHDLIIKKLNTGDTVISFNYDLIADASIAANWNWSEFNGYGFWAFDSYEEHKSDNFETKLSDILLLKPHGSMNWEFNNIIDIEQINSNYVHTPFPERIKGNYSRMTNSVEVKLLSEINNAAFTGRLHARSADFWDELKKSVPKDELWRLKGVERQKRQLLIYPPSFNKFGADPLPEEINQIWSKIYKALLKASKIVCIGFSFTPTDVQFSTLFRLAMSKNKNSDLIIDIVNPDPHLRDRVTKLCAGRPVNKIAGTLQEFAEGV